jgi:predicted pyridoxine 5'-phosphate oxidase superfamily flavin-nucleotide-binding protein
MDAATFHAGERMLQARAGSAERLAQAGPRVVRDHMPQQHRDFFAQLPFIVAGLVDGTGQPWAGVWAGRPGFVHSPDERLLRIDAALPPLDPLAPLVADGAAIGLLGIEPHTRRRNRLNGWVRDAGPGGFSVAVGQSFGNCPKYIQAREARFLPGDRPLPLVERGTGLDEAARVAIGRADTFFIATAHPAAREARERAHGVDVSHRGGPPGFVGAVGDRLTVPDFVGNGFFNTFGNLLLEPRCGLLFLDFDSGDATWVTASAELSWDAEQAARAYAGAQRLLTLQARTFLRLRGALPLRWGAAQPAPELARLGPA